MALGKRKPVPTAKKEAVSSNMKRREDVGADAAASPSAAARSSAALAQGDVASELA